VSAKERGTPSLVNGLRLTTFVHRYAVHAMASFGHAPLMGEDGAGIRTLVVGPDPIRLLVFGGGLAVGYGASSRDEAFDGPLARIVAERSGRGVIVENRAVQHVTVADAVGSLGATGAYTFHAAIWSPSFLDGTRRLRLRSWRMALDAMILELREESDLPLVLACMAVPLGAHPVALIGRPYAVRLNRVISQVAARHEHVVAVETEPFIATEIGAPVANPVYFADVAARLAPAVLELLGVTAPTTGDAARPSLAPIP
jgi:hypothetical protein